MKQAISQKKKYFSLLWEFVKRDIKIKYRRSYLGIIWSLMNPLMMMVVMTTVFSTVFKSSIENFPVYLLSGQIMIIYFAEATNAAMTSVISNGQLLKKIYVPKYLFCLSKIISSAVTLMTSLCAVVVVMLVTGVEIKLSIITAIFPVLYIMIFALGTGLILASMTVFFRDILHLYSVLLLAWQYLTPTFYPLDILPEGVRIFVENNPLTSIVMLMRNATLYGCISPFELHLKAILGCILVLSVGILVFNKGQNKFIFYV